MAAKPMVTCGNGNQIHAHALKPLAMRGHGNQTRVQNFRVRDPDRQTLKICIMKDYQEKYHILSANQMRKASNKNGIVLVSTLFIYFFWFHGNQTEYNTTKEYVKIEIIFQGNAAMAHGDQTHGRVGPWQPNPWPRVATKTKLYYYCILLLIYFFLELKPLVNKTVKK